MTAKRIGVLHLPASIGGQAPMLAAVERDLGLDSRAIAFEPHPFAYAGEEVLRQTGDRRLRFELRRLGLFARTLRRCQVVHGNFGRTFFPGPDGFGPAWRQRADRALVMGYSRIMRGLELRLLASRHRALVLTYQGDDARQGDVLEGLGRRDLLVEVGPDYYPSGSDRAKRASIRRIADHADAVFYLNPDLARVLPDRARFMPYASVDPADWRPQRPTDGSPLMVVHAPSHRGVKGTRFVIDAVDRLRREGLVFEFVLVEGLRHEEARRLYAKADLLVDQLLIGWYGGLAVELMALGKPVVCRLRREDLAVIPTAMRNELPLIDAGPDTMTEVLRGLLGRGRSGLAGLGARSRRFVERWHDPRTIVSHLTGIYRSILTGRLGRQAPPPFPPTPGKA